MKTVIIIENDEETDIHVFDGDIDIACQQAFDKKLFAWPQDAEEIMEAISVGDICAYTTEQVNIH